MGCGGGLPRGAGSRRRGGVCRRWGMARSSRGAASSASSAPLDAAVLLGPAAALLGSAAESWASEISGPSGPGSLAPGPWPVSVAGRASAAAKVGWGEVEGSMPCSIRWWRSEKLRETRKIEREGKNGGTGARGQKRGILEKVSVEG